ncbi:MAG: NAD(P)-binding protein, partial [Bacilli bacterium]|nr:NAD(P)-binding protein [Bacilli bacterium]
MMDKHVIIVGAGFSGAVAARIFARANYKVDIYEKRGSIGGNMYDFKDEDGIIVQKYGPHIFHTSNKDVLDFLSSYTLWNDYKHQVKGYIDGKLVPIPFNLESLELLFSKEDSKYIKEFLVNKFGMNK